MKKIIILLTILMIGSCMYSQSNGYVLKMADGSVAIPNGAITQAMLSPSIIGTNYRTLVTLGGNITNNNVSANTMADVTGLSFPVVSGTTYRFYAMIRYTSAATTTGSRWSISGPANPTTLNYMSTATLSATSVSINCATAYDIPAASSASSLTAGNICIIEGIITPSANGTVIVRFASEISSSAIVALAGSTIEYW